MRLEGGHCRHAQVQSGTRSRHSAFNLNETLNRQLSLFVSDEVINIQPQHDDSAKAGTETDYLDCQSTRPHRDDRWTNSNCVTIARNTAQIYALKRNGELCILRK